MSMTLGVDLCNIRRIERLMLRRPVFAQRFFTQAEYRFFKERNFSAATLAANFALKEAFAKALGTGIRGFNLQDVEVLRLESGAPVIHLYRRAQLLFTEKGYENILCSLSHDTDYCVGMVVLLP